MILIPEIETVVILVPRTASRSTYKAVLEKYPQAMMPYRHMEADGVPQGYDRWEKVGVVRNPIDRLWSLYSLIVSGFNGTYAPAYTKAMAKSVECSFEEWVMNNKTVFTNPYNSGNTDNFYPRYTIRHALPENRKSQFIYLRPDLGTTIYQFSDLDSFADRLGIQLSFSNGVSKKEIPHLSDDIVWYLHQKFAWDFVAIKEDT